MAGSLNRVTLLGNLGKDPEVKRTQGGNAYCNMSIATSETWRDKNTGERKEKTEWHNVTVWAEGLVKVAEQYLKKGSKVLVEGKMQTRKWQAQDGSDRYSTEVVLQGFDAKLVLLGDANGGGGGGRRNDDGPSQQSSGSRSNGGGGRSSAHSRNDDMDDDIPF